MCCAQPRELEPADDVLESHLLERLSQGIVDGILVPRRDPSEVRLDLRPESLDRRVVRSVGPGARAWHPPALRPPRRHKPDGGTGCPTRPRHRRAAPVPVLVRHTTRTPRCRSTPGTPAGHALRPAPARRSRSATPTRGVEPTARSPRGAQPYARVIAVVTPVSSTKTSRFGSTRFTFLRKDRRFSRVGRSHPLSGTQETWAALSVAAFAIRPPAFAIRPPAFAICHLPSAIRHFSFSILHSPFQNPHSAFSRGGGDHRGRTPRVRIGAVLAQDLDGRTGRGGSCNGPTELI